MDSKIGLTRKVQAVDRPEAFELQKGGGVQVMVREGLLDLALQTAAQRFSLWGEAKPISPGDDATQLIRSLLWT